MACSVTCPEATSTPSVISRISASGGNPVSHSASSTVAPKSGSRSCRGDTLTETTAPLARCHSATTRHDSRSTQVPIGTISPLSSATGMNSSGGTIRSPGGRQRSSASTPTIRSSASRISGW